jgi:Tfp pilus assembly protein PilF
MGSSDVLQGWNAIAEFLSCDVRTAKRWESERGLPIRRTRRTPGEGRANVYAIVPELETWRAAAATSLEILPRSVAAAQADSASIEAASSVDVPRSARPPEARRLLARSWLRPAIALTAVCIVAASVVAASIVAWARGHRGAKNVSAPPVRSAPPPPSPANPAPSPVAELYLHGSYLFEQRTPETLGQAKTDFEHAIARDPGYAPAYAGLAKTYDLLREYSTLPSDRAYPLARTAALRSIALDPKLPDAHAALGYEEFFWEWNGVQAESEFRRAIALDPNCSIAHHWYGAMLLHQTRFQEAIRELDRAQMLEPASAGVLGTRAYAIGLSGRRDQAADLLQDILTRVPDSAPLHFILAQLSLQQPRDIPRYLDQMRRFAELRHGSDELQLLNTAEAVYRHNGETAMWRSMLETEERLHPNERTYQMAELEAALGQNDQAIRDLTVLKQQHNDLMIGLAIDSFMTPLRDDARFQNIERQIGLPEVSARNEPVDLPWR